jgi:hypothetical protein
MSGRAECNEHDGNRRRAGGALKGLENAHF